VVAGTEQGLDRHLPYLPLFHDRHIQSELGPFRPARRAYNPSDPQPEQDMHLQELKKKTPAELLAYAEELEIENATKLTISVIFKRSFKK
jgi:hypothetical protein